jgi:glycosyltransferase involved in cell wall biosynthesis
MTPKVSIIIPVYNTGMYLEQCLNSVISQTLREIEIIIVDDASTDNSLEIINVFLKKDIRIKLIPLKVNKGLGAVRNLALKEVSGEYILFLDSDDWLEAHIAEFTYKKIVSVKKDIVLIGHTEYVDNSTETIKILPIYKEEDNDFLKYFLTHRQGFTSTAWSYLFSKSLIIDNGITFSEGIYFEDICFTAKAVFYAKKVGVINDVPLYNYRVRRENSITENLSKKKIEDLYTAHHLLKMFMKEKNIFKKYEKEYFIRFLIYCVMYSFRGYFRINRNDRDKELDVFMKEIRKSNVLRISNLNILKKMADELDNKELQVSNYFKFSYRFLGAIRKYYIPFKFVFKFTSRFLVKS